MKSLKNEIGSTSMINKETAFSIDIISEEYSKYLELNPFVSKIIFIAFLSTILLFVFSRMPPLFKSSWLNTVSKYGFIIHTFLGSYGTVVILSTIICIDRLIKNENIYEIYEHPKYAKSICSIKDFISFITYSIIGLYFCTSQQKLDT